MAHARRDAGEADEAAREADALVVDLLQRRFQLQHRDVAEEGPADVNVAQLQPVRVGIDDEGAVPMLAPVPLGDELQVAVAAQGLVLGVDGVEQLLKVRLRIAAGFDALFRRADGGKAHRRAQVFFAGVEHLFDRAAVEGEAHEALGAGKRWGQAKPSSWGKSQAPRA